MAESKKINRREFIGTSAAIAGITIVPRSVLGGQNYLAPSDKINVAYIGTGSQGIRVLMEFLRHPEIQITMICDANRDSQDYPEWNKDEVRNSVRRFLDEPTWGEGNTGCRGGREVGKEIAQLYYGKNKPSGKFNGIKTYEDFRELLHKEKDIDGVCVMTPEHTHATIAIAAMRQGKHVVNHKPMSNVLSEVRLAAKTAAETSMATHMFCSSTMHTTPLLCEWIWNGAIGQVREVHNWTTRPFWPQGMTHYPRETPPIPDGFNWDLWLGPAEYRPYHPAFTHAAFRGWYDFGTGPMGDMGHYSFFQWWQILKLHTPISVEASRSEYWTVDPGYWEKQINTVSYPRASLVHWEFPEREGMAPVTLHWYDGGLRPPIPEELERDGRKMPEEGVLFIGDNGKIMAEFTGRSPRIIPESKMKEFNRPEQTLPRPEGSGLDQWVAACRGEKTSTAAYDRIRPINETICLGTIALRIGRKLYWDSEKMSFKDEPEADKLLYRTYRKGWELS
jgi:hypothetical protein